MGAGDDQCRRGCLDSCRTDEKIVRVNGIRDNEIRENRLGPVQGDIL
jgi:hypothetical protein